MWVKVRVVKDNYDIGPEGNSLFHIIASRRAAHYEIKDLVELIKYFGKTREFYVDFVAIQGKKLLIQFRTGRRERAALRVGLRSWWRWRGKSMH